MIEIKEPHKLILKIFGVQTVEEGLEYVLSKYVIKEGNAYYNCLTGEAIYVTDEKRERSELIRRWFYLPKDMNPEALAHLLRQNFVTSQSGPGSNLKGSVVIFTTTACNANCKYCFENGYKVMTMSRETASDVADYMIKMRPRTKEVIKIKWFGGEPLVNKDVISIISTKLKDAGIPYSASLSTNGELLDKCTVEELKLWNLRAVQITVDAIGPEYDDIKGMPKGSYEHLKENVKRLESLGIRVNVRVHYDPERCSDICYKLVDEFKDYKNTIIYTRLLYGTESIEYQKELLKIEDYIMDSKKNSFGFPLFNPGTHCMGDNRRVACITPDGSLSLCEHYAYGENIYGSIYSNSRNESLLRKWSQKEKYTRESCKECPLYPSCRKLVMCPAEGKCSDGYQYYQIETIKRALRKKVEEINGRDSNTNN